MRVDDAGVAVDRPVVLWQSSAAFASALDAAFVGYPPPDRAWLERRFWTWIHYGTGKVSRGELFEALDMIAFLRGRVLGPLILSSSGRRPSGVRRIEALAPPWTSRLERTATGYDASGCLEALRASAEIYRELRAPDAAVSAAERAAMRLLDAAIAHVARPPA